MPNTKSLGAGSQVTSPQVACLPKARVPFLLLPESYVPTGGTATKAPFSSIQLNSPAGIQHEEHQQSGQVPGRKNTRGGAHPCLLSRADARTGMTKFCRLTLLSSSLTGLQHNKRGT